MELGALVCLPKPRCSDCPISYACRAYREGRTEAFPPRKSAGPLPIRLESLFLLVPTDGAGLLRREVEIGSGNGEEQAGHRSFGALLRRHNLPLLLVRRAETGLLGGLWELPNFPARGKELAERLLQVPIELILDTGAEVRHRYSHFEIRFQLFLGAFSRRRILDSWTEQRWVAPAELADYPRPKVHIEAMHRFDLLPR
jgi:A/G-specific adenine glycosylase